MYVCVSTFIYHSEQIKLNLRHTNIIRNVVALENMQITMEKNKFGFIVFIFLYTITSRDMFMHICAHIHLRKIFENCLMRGKD